MIEVFTDQAYNLILLAEDEARMLGRATVEPTHLLLALARKGNVERLLAERRITASDIYRAIARTDGVRADLVLGPVPRSRATDEALKRAVDAAAARGVLGPSSEHVLLGLNGNPEVTAILRDVGIDDVERFVDARYPAHRAPLGPEQVRSYALPVSTTRTPPSPGPIAPVFERFTSQAHAAFLAADRSADDVYIEPFHLLLGLLQIAQAVAAKALAAHEVTLVQAKSRTGYRPSPSAFRRFPPQSYPPPPEDAIFGFPAEATRQVLAKGSLKRAHAHRHKAIGTGHLLLGVIDLDDANVTTALGGPEAAQRICATVVDLLPGDEVASVA